MSQAHILVDRIYQIVGCEYLSEIKEHRWRLMAIDAALNIGVEEFTVDQWDYALTYLFSMECKYTSHLEIKAFLVGQLGESFEETVREAFHSGVQTEQRNDGE